MGGASECRERNYRFRSPIVILHGQRCRVHDQKRDGFALSQAFDLWENFLCAYFPVKKNIAQAVNFDFTQHRLAHQDLLNELQRMKDWLMAKNGAWPKFDDTGCIDPLKKYLIQHIKEGGKPLKIVLNTHFYDFNP